MRGLVPRIHAFPFGCSPPLRRQAGPRLHLALDRRPFHLSPVDGGEGRLRGGSAAPEFRGFADIRASRIAVSARHRPPGCTSRRRSAPVRFLIRHARTCSAHPLLSFRCFPSLRRQAGPRPHVALDRRSNFPLPRDGERRARGRGRGCSAAPESRAGAEIAREPDHRPGLPGPSHAAPAVTRARPCIRPMPGARSVFNSSCADLFRASTPFLSGPPLPTPPGRPAAACRARSPFQFLPLPRDAGVSGETQA